MLITQAVGSCKGKLYYKHDVKVVWRQMGLLDFWKLIIDETPNECGLTKEPPSKLGIAARVEI